jgi:membrane fusion protein (multidrug efflux system)
VKATIKYAWIGAATLIAGTVIFAIVFLARGEKKSTAVPDDSDAPAPVTTTLIKSGQVSQNITAYGDVTAQPGAIVVISAPLECQVKHLRVTGGQMIDTGAALIEIQPSPDSRLAILDARNALEGAKKAAASVQQRFDLKMSTVVDLQSANQAVRAAQAKLDDLSNRGAGEQQTTITAAASGIVAKVDVQEGQLVPAGAAMVELVPRGQIEVRFGVEPTDAMLLRSGQAVQMFPPTADDDEPVDGIIRLVTHRVNPDSRLVDVFATPSDTDGLLLDGFIHGELTLKTVSGMVVPHEALLPDDQGFSIFTVVDGHAIKHAVKVALQTDKQAVVVGDGLHEGDVVVIAGNLELDDKAAVNATAATTAPADAEGEK